MTQLPYSPDLVPCDFWLFPKLKSPLKGKRFQTIDEIQENTTGQLMATGRTVWRPKGPTLKGTEASLSYVQCFLYLLQKMPLFFILHAGYFLDRPPISSLFLNMYFKNKIRYIHYHCLYFHTFLQAKPQTFSWLWHTFHNLIFNDSIIFHRMDAS